MKRCICYLAAALGWWSIWYPQIALPRESVQIVDESGTVQDAAEVLECDCDTLSYELMRYLGEEEITIRFKCVEWLQNYVEKVRKE